MIETENHSPSAHNGAVFGNYIDDLPSLRFRVFHFQTRLPRQALRRGEADGRASLSCLPSSDAQPQHALRRDEADVSRSGRRERFGRRRTEGVTAFQAADGRSVTSGRNDRRRHLPHLTPFRFFRVFRGKNSPQVKPGQLDQPLTSFQPCRCKLFGKYPKIIGETTMAVQKRKLPPSSFRKSAIDFHLRSKIPAELYL